MGHTDLLPQIVQLPMVQNRLKSLTPLHELVELLPFRDTPEDVKVLVQKAEEVNLLDHLQLVFLADRVEVYMKVGEVEG